MEPKLLSELIAEARDLLPLDAIDYGPEHDYIAHLADAVEAAQIRASDAFADRDAALERLGAVLAERDQLARLHEVATERTVGLAAVIEQAKAIGDLPMDDMTDEQAVTAILERLASADTDAALREVRATAWDEGYSRGFYDREKLTGDSRDASEGASENPHLEGAKTDG